MRDTPIEPIDPIDPLELKLAVLVRAWTEHALVPVDEVAVVRVAARQRRRRPGVGHWRWPASTRSATRLVSAVIIVALGSGALLFAAGRAPSPLPVQSASPSASRGLLTETVEPDVVRIVNDGVRDLARPIVCDEAPYDCSGFTSNLAVAPDGGVWVFGPEVFYRLGDGASYPTDAGLARLGVHVEASPDGALWWIADGRLTRFEGGSREVQQPPDPTRPYAAGFDLGPAGDVWAEFQDGDCAPEGMLMHWTGEAWSPVATLTASRFEISPTLPEDVLIDHDDKRATLALLQPDLPSCDTLYADLAWTLVGPSGSLMGQATPDVDRVLLWDMDATGGYWAYLQDSRPTDTDPFAGAILVRGDGLATRMYTKDDGIPLTTFGMYDWEPGFLRAAPDGSVWLAGTVSATGQRTWGCNGVARFDGANTTQYLADLCIFAVRIAPDGSAWVLAGARTDAGAVQLYRIRPTRQAS